MVPNFAPIPSSPSIPAIANLPPPLSSKIFPAMKLRLGLCWMGMPQLPHGCLSRFLCADILLFAMVGYGWCEMLWYIVTWFSIVRPPPAYRSFNARHSIFGDSSPSSCTTVVPPPTASHSEAPFFILPFQLDSTYLREHRGGIRQGSFG